MGKAAGRTPEVAAMSSICFGDARRYCSLIATVVC
jgi:hypothetical protein